MLNDKETKCLIYNVEKIKWMCHEAREEDLEGNVEKNNVKNTCPESELGQRASREDKKYKLFQ